MIAKHYAIRIGPFFWRYYRYRWTAKLVVRWINFWSGYARARYLGEAP